MRYSATSTTTPKRLQSALALAAALWVLFITAEATVPATDALDHHAPHSISTGTANKFAAVMDHSHAQKWRVAVSPSVFTMAVLPRVAPDLLALGLAVATLTFCIHRGHQLWSTVRAPPPVSVCGLSGVQLLVRFCIARR